MKNSNIVKLFPKLIYVADDVSLDNLNFLESYIVDNKNNTQRNNYLNVDSSKNTIKKLKHIHPFNKLCDEVLHHMKIFLSEIGYSKNRIDNLYISDCWFNVSGKGDFNAAHIHAGSVLSAAFYVKVCPENIITFFNSNLFSCIEPPDYPLEEINSSEVNFKCEKGRLIIFPSDFMHSTPSQQSENLKIMISFNSLFENKNEI